MSRPRAVLIGPPGAGKSTVGRLLAQRWGVPFVDTDEEVEAEAGRSVSDIFVEDGEPAFRAREAQVLRRCLTGEGVLALGGGAPLHADAPGLLAGHRVVFLDVGIADAAGRIGLDRSRPLLAVNPRASWTRLMAQRRPTYTALASVTVDTAGRTAEQVADLVAAGLDDEAGATQAGASGGREHR